MKLPYIYLGSQNTYSTAQTKFEKESFQFENIKFTHPDTFFKLIDNVTICEILYIFDTLTLLASFALPRLIFENIAQYLSQSQHLFISGYDL